MKTIHLLAGALLLQPLAVLAQSIDVNGGDVRIVTDGAQITTSGNDAVIKTPNTRIKAKGNDASIHTDGARVKAQGDAVSIRADDAAAQRAAARSRVGSTSSTVVSGGVVNHASGAGAVSEQTINGHTTISRDETVVTRNGQTTVHTETRTRGPASVSYVNEELEGANFSGRQLASVAFTNATLIGADFSNADLRNANFANADLSRAQLSGANMSGADITNADFGNASLDGATWVDGRVCGPGSRGSCQ